MSKMAHDKVQNSVQLHLKWPMDKSDPQVK